MVAGRRFVRRQWIWTEIIIIIIILFRGIFGSLGVWEYRSLDDTDVGGIRDLDRNYYNYYNFVSARSDLQSDHYEYEHL